MDFGDIFFIAVFIIIIVSNVYKQMKKARLNASGNQTPVKKPGWRSALEMILEEARKQMENQAKQESAGAPASRPSGWESILSGQEPDISQPEAPARTDKTGPDIVKPEKSVTERPAPVKMQETRQQPLRLREEQHKRTGPVVVEKDYYADGIDKIIPRHLSQEALRNAVVWAEILAPPVGLRDM